MRVIIITNMIPPYRDPLFEEIAKNKLINKLSVFTCKENEPNRKWIDKKNYYYEVKKFQGVSIIIGNKLNPYKILHLYPSMILNIMLEKPDHIILGDISLTTYLILSIVKLIGIKTTLWYEDSREIQEVNKISKYIKSFFYKFINNYITPSASSKKQLVNMGIKSRRIEIIPNAVENSKFLKLYKKNKLNKIKLKKTYKIESNIFCFTYIGQLIKRKRILETINLLTKTAKKNNIKILFIIAGQGDLSEEINELLIKNKFLDYKIFPYLNEKKLSEIYTISDSLILLSRNEPWGMVINEAMIHNLAFLTTDKVEAANYYKSEYKKSTVINYKDITEETIYQHMKLSKKRFTKLTKPIDPKGMADKFIEKIK